MQVTQTLSQGLKHEFKVVLPVGELAAKLETQLVELRSKAQIKGFRPGKAPISYLKKIYGKGIMGEVLQEAVNEANRKIVEDNGLRVAMEPKLDFPVDQAVIEKALEAEGDFSYSVAFEVLPTIRDRHLRRHRDRAPGRRGRRRGRRESDRRSSPTASANLRTRPARA